LAKATDAVLADNGPQSIEVVEGPYSQIVRILHDGALDVISARCGRRRLLMNFSKNPCLKTPTPLSAAATIR